MLAGELAHQAGMKKPKIRAADWDYLSKHPKSGPPRASAAIWPQLLIEPRTQNVYCYFTNPSLNKTACYFEQQVNIRGSAFYRLAILSYSAHEKPPQQTSLSMQGIFFYLPFANNPEQ
ncbi:MAG: hypothetical protein RL608_118 [Bacteroidota bacterium]|jgi:Flp pilus assembly protein TadD